ncbi:MAG: hypothetical protein H6510_12550 [Acidobacteria bacterium]|nr:hypothetical protein [Acidobacteriota bacterium]MCB9398636.1 hypothetical protein [Acidobacteriota bacterium]
MAKWIGGFFLFLPLVAQTQINGTATVWLEDAGLVCQGHARQVRIWADVSALSGAEGAAAINSFVLKILTSQPNPICSLQASGAQPLDWFYRWNRSGNQLTWVGAFADTDPASGPYLLGVLTVCGSSSPVVLDIDEAQSGFGSRSISGSLPSTIALGLVPAPSLVVPAPFSEGSVLPLLPFWLGSHPYANLVAPNTRFDILDLASMVNCLHP